MTTIEVIDAARALLNEPLESSRSFPDNTSSFWTDSTLLTYHNVIQQEVQQEVIQAFEDHFVTQTFLSIVNGTAEYALPSGFIKMRRVEDLTYSAAPVEIIPVSLNNRGGVVKVLNCSTYQGCGYYLRGNQVILTDTPTYTNSATIRLHFVKALSDITAGSASSELPEGSSRCLIWGIVKMAIFQQQGDTTLANAEYEKNLNKLKQQSEGRQIQRPRSVIQSSERGL